MFSIVVATDLNLGIGKNNTLPWRIKKDMNYFKDLTISTNPEEIKDKYGIWNGNPYSSRPISHHDSNFIIMGRKTWDSIPPKFRPLDKRLNCIISKNMEEDSNINVFRDFNSAIQVSEEMGVDYYHTYVIGGAEIYRQATEHEKCSRIYQTVIYKEFECDTFFPKINNFQQVAASAMYEENGLEFQFKILEKN